MARTEKWSVRPQRSHLGLITFAYHQVVHVSRTHRNHRRSERGGAMLCCPTLSHMEIYTAV
jgi:hypothetical protein